MRPRVVVIGGGLTGLATAWRLRERAEVVLLEAGGRLGGQIHTIELHGTRIDVGADAFLTRQPAGPRLLDDAGLADDLVAPAGRQVLLWRRGTLRPLPRATVFGVPSEPRALVRSRVLSPSGTLRAALEPAVPRRFVAGDRSVADLVGERFGREVVDVLVEPLLGGVYAGRADQLSAEATLPPVWEAARSHRSLGAGLRTTLAGAAERDGPVFVTVRGGLARLVARLGTGLGERVRLRSPATSIALAGGGGWTVAVGTGRPLIADHVVLAVPAAPAARLVGPLAPDAARELATVRTASVGVVALTYDPAETRHIPDLSGLLVPRHEGRIVKAVTVASRKWPHLAPGQRFVVRASVGRIDDTTALDLPDETLADRVDAEVREALGIRSRASGREVVRWPDALPQYDVGHRQRVDRLRHALREAELDGLHLAGATFDGVGLSARATEAERLAAAILAAPRTAPGAREAARAGGATTSSTTAPRPR